MLKNIKKIKLTHIVLFGMLCFVLFNGSFFSLVHNKMELRRLKKQNSGLDEEYVRLAVELERLQKERAPYIEELARGKYHMSAPGETEIRF